MYRFTKHRYEKKMKIGKTKRNLEKLQKQLSRILKRQKKKLGKNNYIATQKWNRYGLHELIIKFQNDLNHYSIKDISDDEENSNGKNKILLLYCII